MILLEILFSFCMTYYDIWYIRWNTISNTNPKYHNIIWQLVQDIEWEERVLTEGSNVDPRKTATEDHQSKSYSLLCYIFFYSDMEKQTPMQRWMEYCVRSSHTGNSPPELDLQQLRCVKIWWLQTGEFSSFQ